MQEGATVIMQEGATIVQEGARLIMQEETRDIVMKGDMSCWALLFGKMGIHLDLSTKFRTWN